MSVARELFDLRHAGTYLPAILLVLLQPDLPTIPVVNLPLLPVLAGFSLIAAVLFHGLSRNAFGVGGPEENPQNRDEGGRRILEAAIGDGLNSTPSGVLQLIFLTTFFYLDADLALRDYRITLLWYSPVQPSGYRATINPICRVCMDSPVPTMAFLYTRLSRFRGRRRREEHGSSELTPTILSSGCTIPLGR